MGKVVLMSGYGLIKGLAIGEAAKVEGGAPAVLIKIRSKVVIMTSERSILSFPSLQREVVNLDRKMTWQEGH